MTRLHLETAAKINLDLKVLERRSDGFHELRTRFQTIDLGDRLELEAVGDSVELSVEGTSLSSGPDNLVRRAAEMLLEAAGGARGVSIRLVKRVPMGAGLGGGSADAAATLVGLDRLWNLRLPDSALHRMAAELGSDVPFFLVGGTVDASGRGEILEPREDLPDEEFLLLLPSGGLPTAEVYRRLAEDRRAPLTKDGVVSTIPFPGSSMGRGGQAEAAGNDLEPAAFALRPDLSRLRDRLFRMGASTALLSGSGVALFGRFPGRRVPAESVEGWPDDVEVRRSRFLPRDQYRARLGVVSATGV